VCLDDLDSGHGQSLTAADDPAIRCFAQPRAVRRTDGAPFRRS
jgi:hypothetical protein